jgi:predicted AAA+ superfamily ATPase
MFKRQIIDILKEKIEKVSVLFLLGPRQSGKTTLVKQLFPDFTYISFEDPEHRLQAATNPKKFLKSLPETLILDDVHLVPGLFRFLAVYAHTYFKTKKWIVLSPVNGFRKNEKPVPLSGYVSFLVLLPLGYYELSSVPENYEEALFTGGFPAAIGDTDSLSVFFTSYLNTFLQKDLWLLKRIRNIPQFLQFLKHCAVRAGQTLDYSGLAHENGISVNAAKQWVQLLEDAFIIFMLPPFHDNFGKRRVRTPKMYFYDTGLLSFLLGIKSPNELLKHPAKNVIFENFFLLEQMKFRLNHGLPLNSFFWRDNRKNELKCVIDGQPPHMIEFYADKKFTKDILKQVKLWKWLSGYNKETCHVVYGGNQSFQFLTSIYSWRDLNPLFSVLEN